MRVLIDNDLAHEGRSPFRKANLRIIRLKGLQLVVRAYPWSKCCTLTFSPGNEVTASVSPTFFKGRSVRRPEVHHCVQTTTLLLHADILPAIPEKNLGDEMRASRCIRLSSV